MTDTEKEVIKQQQDRNYKYAINKPGLWERIRKKCLCAAKMSVNFGMCFNGTIRRP